MSNWGMSKNRTNKLVIQCDNLEQAEIVERNAKNRSEMTFINICTKKPYFNQDRYCVSEHDKNDYSNWFIPNWFKSKNYYTNKIEEYKHNNQKLLNDGSDTYTLISYSTEVLKVINGKIVLDQSGKISVTTSKHISQAKSYLASIGVLN